MKIAVIGAGTWGTTVASLVSQSATVKLWARRPELAAAINRDHQNPDYLEGFDLPEELVATSELDDALSGAEVVVMAVPSHGFRLVLEAAAAQIPSDAPIISLAKGLEAGTRMCMTAVVRDALPDHDPGMIGVLTGPNLAREILAGQPAASVVSVSNEDVAAHLRAVFQVPTLRVYSNTDVIGSEIAGALKNVMALGAGMAAGLGYGDNSMATFITRALAELSRLGRQMGGDPLTFAGLAGMGDLIATCVSPLSRNRRVGVALAEGRSLDEIVADMKMVAEGVKTTPVVLELAEEYGVEMPLADRVARVLEGQSVSEMLTELMGRPPKAEIE